MTSLRVTFSELDLAAQSLGAIGDDLQGVIGSLALVLEDGVAGCGGDPATTALAIFQHTLTESVLALAAGLADIGGITAAASVVYETTDDSLMGA